MFDTVTAAAPRNRGRKRWLVGGVSIAAHAVVLAAVVIVPLTAVTAPPVPVDMMAFVAPPPVVPPPPPPPAPAPARTSARRPTTIVPDASLVAPREAPSAIVPEPAVPAADSNGVVGGVEGGVRGGIVGGIVGGLTSSLPPPPPPPPAPAPAPVRIGGALKAPALETSVTPEYPAIALAAHLQGLVVLEASVDKAGRVASIKILRSAGLLDQAAIDAVKQWRYMPLKLDGQPTPFVLTVTLNFQLPAAASATGGVP